MKELIQKKGLNKRLYESEGQVFDSCPKELESYLNRFSLYVVSYRFPIELVIGGKDIQKAFLCQIFTEENESAAAKRATGSSTEPGATPKNKKLCVSASLRTKEFPLVLGRVMGGLRPETKKEWNRNCGRFHSSDLRN